MEEKALQKSISNLKYHKFIMNLRNSACSSKITRMDLGFLFLRYSEKQKTTKKILKSRKAIYYSNYHTSANFHLMVGPQHKIWDVGY